LNVLDLFSGIGGFSLGLERAGMRTVAFCEIDPFCRKILAKHWPTVPCYEDVRTITAERLAANAATGDVQIDVICGGFPCQDITRVGPKIGIRGTRSGLWVEYARIIREIRPRFVIVENSTGLLNRGMGDVLGDLAECGFDAEWSVLSACALGASHSRERLFLVAYPHEHRPKTRRSKGDGYDVAAHGRYFNPEYVHSSALAVSSAHWNTLAGEPTLDRVADGVPNRVDALSSLGNAVVPQIPEIIGRAIMRTINE
jgi:DNA (cytosine-5)-methyltransferase 1